ncbi:MAG: sulfocyanin-like copper-binding protein [Acidimicrobiales bacterium]
MCTTRLEGSVRGAVATWPAGHPGAEGETGAAPQRRGARRRRALLTTWTLAAVAVVCASCGGGSHALASSAILRTDGADRTVALRLDASATGALAGFNFDGFGEGRMRVHVPVGWRVEVTCTNESTTLTHSCAVVEDRRLSPYGASLAFQGASTPDPRAGLGFGKTARFAFVASRVGTYRIACLVVGHEIDGMWDWLTVTAGDRPYVTT